MNQSLEALMGSVRRALSDEILPELVSEHARSQLAGVLDVLGKIESMVVWSPDVTREQLELLDACLAQAAARIAGTGLACPDITCHPDHNQFAHTQAGLEAALADAERRFAILTDWLFASPAGLPAEVGKALHELQRTTLRNTLKAQRRLVPSADFSSMTAPGQPAAAQGVPT
jgi:hypothetical protein